MPAAVFGKLFPQQKVAGYATAVVISHDCDLAASVEAEPRIELLLCKQTDKLDGNYAASKNSRHLQLHFQNAGAKIVLDILAVDKIQIDKIDLLNERHNETHLLSREDLRILQLWLSDRYARSSFSNNFNDILKPKEFTKKWMKIIEPLGATVDAIYFDVDDSDDVVRKNGDPPFELSIYLRFSLTNDALGSEKATKAAAEVKALFRKSFFDEERQCWVGVHLKLCEAVSSEALTVAVHQNLRIWDLAYLSLRAFPQQLAVRR